MEDRSVLDRVARAPDAVVGFGAGDLPGDNGRVADVYRPARTEQAGREAAPRPLLILVHGGYWRPQYDRMYLRPMAEALAAAGWTVVLPEYARVPGDPDATLADVRLALRRLPALIMGHDGRVILAGHSAGGHLALCVAATQVTTPTGLPVPGAMAGVAGGLPEGALAGVLALAPVADLAQADALNVDDGAVSDFLGVPAVQRPDLDPCRLPAPAAPVTVIHGDADTLAPPVLARAYGAAHPAARLRWLAGAGHFAVIDSANEGVWPVVLDEFLELAAPGRRPA